MGLIQTGIVTGKQTAKNKDGTKNVLLLQVEMADPEDVQTVELMSQTGENSNPPVGSRVVVVGAGHAFKIAIASDDSIVPTTADGEKIIYSTNEAGTAVVSSVYLKNDGTIIANNGAVTITAEPGGLLSIVTSGNTEITSTKTIINNDVDINGKVNINDGGNIMSMGGAGMNMGTGVITGSNVFNGADSNAHRHDTTTNPSGVPQ
jgi:phage gp45-like